MWDLAFSPYRISANPNPYDTSFGIPWTVPTAFRSSEESIQDGTGTDGRFRDCLHTYESNEFSAPLVNHRFVYGCHGNSYVRNMPSSRVALARGLRAAPAIDMNAYAEQALAFMMPELNKGTSMVNSLLELKDLKRMNPSGSLSRIRHRHTALKDLADPRRRKAFVKELTSRLNSAHLNAQFGIVPFVADIVGIHDELCNIASRLAWLKKRANTPLVRHYKRVVPEDTGVKAVSSWKEQVASHSWASLATDHYPWGTTRPSVTTLCRARWVKRPVYHATMRYTYTLPKMDSQYETVLAKLDVLGIRLDPSIVWNAIPFSFVVDWVVDVSGFLGSFARDNYPINTHLLDFCHSYSWHREQEIEVSYLCPASLDSSANHNGLSPKFPPKVRVYNGTSTYYYRARALPSTHTARLKRVKLKQAALAGSLLLAKTAWGNRSQYLRDLTSTWNKVPKKKARPSGRSTTTK